MIIELKLKNGSSPASSYWQMTMQVQSFDYILKPPSRAGIDGQMVQLVVFVDKVIPTIAKNFLDKLGVGRGG
jgi:hypothetical protein